MKTIPKKNTKSQRDKSYLGDHFIAPDGGWGWLVCIAGGFSNLCIAPVIATFGLIFREELKTLGFSNSEITTIINTQQAVLSCTGLINGPMFRRFSYRQVALTGSSIVAISIFLISTANSFITYVIYFSILFGFGMGINVSATALALNTYFKEKRRRASSLSCTVTGLGPFIMPYIITILLPYYGVRGVVLILGALSLNGIACSLVYQPVKWHVKKETLEENENDLNIKNTMTISKSMTSIFASQYLYNEDDENERGYEIIEPGIPMLVRANDGWYGSKLSLKSIGLNNTKMNILLTNKDLEQENDIRPNNFYRELEFHKSNNNLYSKTKNGYINCQCSDEKIISNPNNIIIDKTTDISIGFDKTNDIDNISWYKKIMIFFDLDLLKDITYVNLMFGMTFSNFADLNFSTLTPFFLSDYGFSAKEIALFMSLMAGADIIVRFLVPFVVSNINWDNRIFFLISLVGMVFGRIIIGVIPKYHVVLVLFIWLGCCKGLRTVFLSLIIPSYVPLHRLPAASGLQLLTAGIFTLLVGPIVGILRDTFSSYTIPLNFLNILSLMTVISWSIELIYRSYKKRDQKNIVLGSSIR